MKGNIKKYIVPKGIPFTMFANNALEREDKPLTSTDTNVLLRLLSFSEDFYLRQDYLAKYCRIDKKTLGRSLERLEKYGYVFHYQSGRDGKRDVFQYEVYAVPKDEYGDIVKTLKGEDLRGAFAPMQMEGENAPMQMPPLNNNIKLKETYQKEETSFKAETSFHMKNSSDNSFNNNNHDTCEHVTYISTDTSTISEKTLTKHDNMEIGGLTKLNNSENTDEQSYTVNHKPKRVSQNCVKGVDSSGNKTRNMMEVHEAQPKMSVKDIMPEQEGFKGSEQTALDKEASNTLRETKEMLAQLKAENEKQAMIAKRITDNSRKAITYCKQADMDISDAEVRENFKNFINHVANLKITLTQAKYDTWKKQLAENTSKEDKINMLQYAIANDKPIIYKAFEKKDKKDFKKSGNKTTTNPIKDKKVEPVADKTTIETQVEDDESTALVTDENGNLKVYY